MFDTPLTEETKSEIYNKCKTILAQHAQYKGDDVLASSMPSIYVAKTVRECLWLLLRNIGPDAYLRVDLVVDLLEPFSNLGRLKTPWVPITYKFKQWDLKIGYEGVENLLHHVTKLVHMLFDFENLNSEQLISDYIEDVLFYLRKH
jgi:hypothetical protein